MKTQALKVVYCAFLLAAASAVSSAAVAQSSTSPSIIVRGRTDVTLTTPEVRLADIAEVASDSIKDDEAIIALKKIIVERSPAPGATLTLSASQILDRMRSQGVNLSGIGYVLPRVISVKRASRTLGETEVKSAIETFLGITGRDAAIKDVSIPRDIQVYPGDIQLQVVPLVATTPGHMGFTVRAVSEGNQDVAFQAAATMDEWREVPVARRPLPKGEVVGPDDVMMARMNISKLPKDVAAEGGGVVGYKVGKDVAPGEVFRLDKLAIPPLVESGTRVTLVYRSGLLEATATGTALDSGLAGQVVKVRNENSKKVVSGTVLETGLVEVKQ